MKRLGREDVIQECLKVISKEDLTVTLSGRNRRFVA